MTGGNHRAEVAGSAEPSASPAGCIPGSDMKREGGRVSTVVAAGIVDVSWAPSLASVPEPRRSDGAPA